MVSPCCLPPPAAPSPLVGVERGEAGAQRAQHAAVPVPPAAPLAPLAPGGKPSPGNPGKPGLPPSFLMIIPIGSMVLLYMVTWIPSYSPNVSIYTSTMDPMGMIIKIVSMILMNISDIYSSSTIKIYCDVKKIDLCENHHELTLGTQASANLRKDESSSMFMHSAQRTRLASKRQPSQLPSKNPAHTNPKSSFNIVKHIHSPTIPPNYQLTQKKYI